MRNKTMIMLALLVLPFTMNAQLGKFIDKAKNKAQQRIDNKVDKSIDQTLDKMEGRETASDGQAQNEPVSQQPKQEAVLTSYSKYDFIPGEKVIYSEDFAQDETGELPLNWNTSGKAEVVTLNAFQGRWLKIYQNALYLTANKDSFTRNFTFEFDLILNVKSNGWLYPEFQFGFLASNDLAPNDNELLREFDKYAAVNASLHLGEYGSTSTRVESYLDNRKTYYSEIQNLASLEKYYGKPAHVAVQVQDKRIRIWFNGEKKFDLPMAVPAGYAFNQVFFKLSPSNYKDDMLSFYIGNLKVATGKPDSRHKLVEEGKFSTTGILFDVQSATIKPESSGVVREIAALMKANPDMRLKIVGHTSNDGEDAANLELSRKRAAAVKEMLVKEFGADETKLETEGRGETQPVADNKTREGKAQNRRVEFIKL
jgi:OmpA-OmpF porin, OOP family